MAKKTKEKNKNRNTKEDVLNLDNEIIIGIKTLPQPEAPKKKESKQKVNKRKKPIKKKEIVKTKNKKKIEEDEFELKLGIEDQEVKRKQNTKKRKTTKQQEIAKRKRKIVFRIVKYTTLLMLLIGGGIAFLLSSFFNVKQINTIGNSKITTEELISLSGIELDQNTFKVQTSKVTQAIKQNAYIETVSVRRKLPNIVEIQIQERTPTFMLTFANAYVYLNNQGYLLEVSQNKIDVPIITGFLTSEEELHAGNRLCMEDLQRLDEALQIMKSAKSNGIENLITKINIADKQDYILDMQAEKKIVHMGHNSNLSTKMLYINSILKENKNIEGEILVNTDLNNKRSNF